MIMKKFNQVMNIVDRGMSWVFRGAILTLSCLIGLAGFKTLGILSYNMTTQMVGAALITLIAIPIIWSSLRVLAFFNS